MALDDPDRQQLNEFRERFAQLVDLGQVAALLSWDQQTGMPAAASGQRASQSASLAGLIHDQLTDRRTGELLDALERVSGNLDEADAAALRVSRREFERGRKLPAELVRELSRNQAEGQAVWEQARATADFDVFVPVLERGLELQRRQADYLGFDDHPYDALLDAFEPGATTAGVREVFAPLRDETVKLLAAITDSGTVLSDELLKRSWPEELQQQFSREVASQFGFDFLRGRLDRAVHPFATSIGNRDVRITTRYDRNFLSTALFGTLHEAGHGMYEQGIADEHARSLAGVTSSLALHESQSRLWENLIGRSSAFWEFAWPRLSELFAQPLAGVEREQFLEAINVVKPSLIRVEADEVTYNLHIMVRFELELELIEGSLQARDLPEAWNERYRDYLGVTPANAAEGCLQDVHWSAGLFGYFPTYSLGNLMSVQLLEAHRQVNPELDSQVRSGDFSRLADWLRDNVHRHGSALTSAEVLQRATGRPLDAAPYVDYLKQKYGRLYGLAETDGE